MFMHDPVAVAAAADGLDWTAVIPVILGGLFALLGYPITYFFVRKAKKHDLRKEEEDKLTASEFDYRAKELQSAIDTKKLDQQIIETLRKKVEELYGEVARYSKDLEDLRVDCAESKINLRFLVEESKAWAIREKDFREQIAQQRKRIEYLESVNPPKPSS